MQTVTKHFNDQPVKILVGDENNCGLFNLVDVAKILNLELKQILDDEELKSDIAFYEELHKKKNKNTQFIIVESSEEIYLHHMLILKISFKVNVKFYLWSFDARDEVIELIVRQNLKLTSKI